jgi:energy-coupling factor transporter ATP-binding protein EcfA2
MATTFDKRTRRLCAARAGYRCSFPDCNQITIGPGAASDEYSMTGTASHIFGASEAGPRGDGDHSPADLAAPENAIWLCALHSRAVDANRGDKYPPALLRAFRDEHEARIAAEHEGSPYFWIASIEMGRNPVFREHERLRFTKVTLVVGNNATGKSTLLRWLDQLGESSRRWDAPSKGKTQAISYSVEIHTPKPRLVRVYRDEDHLQFFLDGREALFNPIATEVIHLDRHRSMSMLESHLGRCRREHGERWESELDDVEIVAEYMDVNPLFIPNLLPHVGRFVKGSFVNLRIASTSGRRRIVGDDLNRKNGISIHQASGSMLSRAVLDMQIAMASLSSSTRPTLLLLNLPVLHLDPTNLEAYVSFLASSAIRFQTVFTTPEVKLAASTSDYGWSAVELKDGAPNCIINALSW